MFVKSIGSGDTLRFGDAGEARFDLVSRRKGIVQIYGTFASIPAKPVSSGTRIQLTDTTTIIIEIDPERSNRVMVKIEAPRDVQVQVLRRLGNLSS